MTHWLHVAFALLMERFEARRDAKIRFLKAEVQILRRKLSGNRVILDPKDRCNLLRLGGEVGHQVKDIIGLFPTRPFRGGCESRCKGINLGKSAAPA